MANMTPVGVIATIENLNGFTSGLGKMESSIAGIGKAALKIGAVAAGAAVAGIGALSAGAYALGSAAVSSASDVSEMESLFNVVFKQGADDARKKLDAFSDSVGRNKYELHGFAGTIGALINPMGLTEAKTAEMSTGFAQLAVDLSSFFNVTESDALEALRSGLVGESEPLRRFGVNINDAAIKQQALNLGLYNGKGELTAAAKAQAVYALVMKETAQAQGDAERTGGGFANQTRALTATWQQFITDVGMKLLPVVTPLLTSFNQLARDILPILGDIFTAVVIPAIQRFGELAQEGQEWLRGFMAMIKDVMGGLDPNMIAWDDMFPGWVANIITWLIANLPAVKALLADIGNVVSAAQAKIGELFAAFQAGGLGGVFAELANTIQAAWPGIQAALFEWAGNFWTWLTGPGGALERAAEEVGKLAVAAADAITRAWPGVRDALLSWAGQFWDWLTGPGGPIELAASKIILFVNEISAQIKERWPYIQSELLFWGGEWWDWFTGPGGPVEMATSQIILFANAVSTEIVKQWPGVRDALLKWAQAFWDWLTAKGGALDQLSANMQVLVTALNAWVTGPGKPQIEELGRVIGRSIVEGIKALFTSKEGGESVVQAFIKGLFTLAASLQDSIKQAGLAIAKGIILGIIEGITGKEASDQLKRAIDTTLKSLGDSVATMTNPFSKLIQKVGELRTALSQLTIPSWLRPGSPTPLEFGVRGIADAMTEMGRIATPALTSALSISPNVTPAAMPVVGGRATMPAVGGAGGGVTLNFGGVTISNGMDLEMFGAFVERRVAAALG